MYARKHDFKLHLKLNKASIYTIKIKTSTGNRKFISVSNEVKEEFIRQKKENKSQRNEYDRHIEHLQLTEVQINARAFNKCKSVEEDFFENEGVKEIIREIWKLPEPQNRRVYMYVVDEFSLTEIAKIEKRAISVVKRSIDFGLKKLRKNLKNL